MRSVVMKVGDKNLEGALYRMTGPASERLIMQIRKALRVGYYGVPPAHEQLQEAAHKHLTRKTPVSTNSIRLHVELSNPKRDAPNSDCQCDGRSAHQLNIHSSLPASLLSPSFLRLTTPASNAHRRISKCAETDLHHAQCNSQHELIREQDQRARPSSNGIERAYRAHEDSGKLCC
ncbi:hypothetical protein CYLTODRAFT_76338 [Cylindrobasidium torrendii FP15055 ss-10]|uniref:Uncharacterized protein n=1 Tax=Cylindrobasidium torrendii FP15055 ss-10 TaxID=1314674 RepID=A0A0D7B4F0_9AGAR|nr:hypothetical protein CYLTODRAFT_76338 [Cylindrobasidium torrendii FP15055 ss-10]